MGISNVAVKTFDSSGSQSLYRTNEYSGDEEVKSSFISKSNKLYISGSGETVIPGSLRVFPTTNSVDTFNINSDTDAISDITLNIEFRLKKPPTGTAPASWDANVCKDIILAMINKVEIKTGSLTAQTLTADDIYIRNLTELGQPFTFSAPFENAVKEDKDGAGTADHRPLAERNVWKHHSTAAATVLVIQAACSIPFMGRSKDMSRSLLQAGALTNAVTAKVYYNNIYTSNSLAKESHYQILSAGNGSGGTGTVNSGNFLDINYFKSFVTVKTHIISETEKNFISKNIIHKVLNTSSNVTKDIPKKTLNTPTEGVTDVEVDLENVSLNVSHLLIGIRLPHVNNKKLSVDTGITKSPDEVDLTSATGDNQLSTPFSVIDSQTFYEPTMFAADNLFGYMPNAIESMELVIGSDRTGFIKGASAKIGGCENFTLLNSDKNSAHYIVTLAEKAFDTSGVPFSKCNNKKLLIKLNNFIFNTNVVTSNPLSGTATEFPQNAVITVTACGTKVQTVVGGSMSFM